MSNISDKKADKIAKARAKAQKATAKYEKLQGKTKKSKDLENLMMFTAVFAMVALAVVAAVVSLPDEE